MDMKLLFDHQTFTHQEFGGISRYYYEIIKEFKTYENMRAECSIVFSNNEYIRDNVVIPHNKFFPRHKFKGRNSIMLAINQIYSLQVIRKGSFNIFHPTYYDPYYLNLKISKPIVVTCLDLIQEKYIQSDLKTLSNKKKVLLRADKIMAISQCTKNDLMDFYNIPSSKIAVTYLASSINKTDDGSIGSITMRYFLYVGNRKLYKNFVFFVSSIAPLLKDFNDIYLICAGGGNFDKSELILLKDLNIQDKVKFERATDENLGKLYSNAIAFFYPSLYEGFGIPILEAMNCGCPVAASNVSSLPEIGGNAACYFDPLNRESIIEIALELLTNEKMRSDLIEKGYSRAKDFSWKKTAKEIFQNYLTML